MADPARHLPLGDLAFLTLLSLADGPLHGYAIGKEVEERSGGRLDPTTGALYQALRRLAEAGLVDAADPPDEAADARRKYFAITRFGRRVVTAEAERLDAMVSMARERRLYPAG
jgi:DNA-binding PadR family transcriptional regulator